MTDPPFGQRLRGWVPAIMVAMAAAAVCAIAVNARQPDLYVSTTRLLVGPVSADEDTLKVSSKLVRTYAALANSRYVRDAADREAGLPDASGTSVRATGNPETRILSIRAESGDAATSRALADAVATEVARLAPTEHSPALLTVVDRASPTESHGVDLGLAAGGSLLAVALAAGGFVLLAEEALPGRMTAPALSHVVQVPVLPWKSRGGGITPSTCPVPLEALGTALSSMRVKHIAVVGTSEATAPDQAARWLAGALEDHGTSVVYAPAAFVERDSRGVGDQLDSLRGDAETLVVNAGTLDGDPDAFALAAAADGTVLVAHRADAAVRVPAGVADLRRGGVAVLAVLVDASASGRRPSRPTASTVSKGRGADTDVGARQ